MKDEDLRFECLKLAFDGYVPKDRLDTYLDAFKKGIPTQVMIIANKYFEYLKTGKIIEME